MTRFARIWLQLIPELLFEFQCEVNGIRASWLIAGDFFVVSGHSRLCPGCGGMWERESRWAVAEGVRCREKLSEQCTDCVPILGLDSLLCKTFLLDGQHQGVEFAALELARELLAVKVATDTSIRTNATARNRAAARSKLQLQNLEWAPRSTRLAFECRHQHDAGIELDGAQGSFKKWNFSGAYKV
jgi:hypothetical protein